jgi:hypothetical protein
MTPRKGQDTVRAQAEGDSTHGEPFVGFGWTRSGEGFASMIIIWGLDNVLCASLAAALLVGPVTAAAPLDGCAVEVMPAGTTVAAS